MEKTVVRYEPFITASSIRATDQVLLQKALSLSWVDADGNKFFSNKFVGYAELEMAFHHPTSTSILYIVLRLDMLDTGEWIPSIKYFQPMQVELDRQPVSFWLCWISMTVFMLITVGRLIGLVLHARSLGVRGFFEDGWNMLHLVQTHPKSNSLQTTLRCAVSLIDALQLTCPCAAGM